MQTTTEEQETKAYAPQFLHITREGAKLVAHEGLPDEDAPPPIAIYELCQLGAVEVRRYHMEN